MIKINLEWKCPNCENTTEYSLTVKMGKPGSARCNVCHRVYMLMEEI